MQGVAYYTSHPFFQYNMNLFPRIVLVVFRTLTLVSSHICGDSFQFPLACGISCGSATNLRHTCKLHSFCSVLLFPASHIVGYSNIDHLVSVTKFILVSISFAHRHDYLSFSCCCEDLSFAFGLFIQVGLLVSLRGDFFYCKTHANSHICHFVIRPRYGHRHPPDARPRGAHYEGM